MVKVANISSDLKSKEKISVFISQPMGGLTDEEIEKERNRAEEAVRAQFGGDVEFIDSFFNGDETKGDSPMKLLARSIDLLSAADLAYFCKGWNLARGCRLEHSCASAYGVSRIEEYASDLKRVGGRIFYIDESVKAKYEFYDAQGNLLPDPKVGDRPAWYSTDDPKEKPKYWILHEELFEEREWTYWNLNTHGYARDSIGTDTSFGSGIDNTEKVLSFNGGAYIRDYTIWGVVRKVRENAVGECSDWFVPSKKELDKLREAAGVLGIDWFDKEWIWSSSERAEYSANHAWYWDYDNQAWSSYGKDDTYSVCVVRAF